MQLQYFLEIIWYVANFKFKSIVKKVNKVMAKRGFKNIGQKKVLLKNCNLYKFCSNKFKGQKNFRLNILGFK